MTSQKPHMRSDGESMVIRPKDAARLFGIFIMCFCGAFVCTLFLNSNIDMELVKDQITDPEIMTYHNAVITSGKATAAITGGALILTSAVLLAFYIKNYIDAHGADLGILKAMGYSNFKVAKSFWVFGTGVFIGTALGLGAAYLFMPFFYKDMRSDAKLPEVSPLFHPELLIYLILLPTLAFVILSVLYSCRKLKQPALELIRGKSVMGKQRKKRKDDQDQNMPFLRELQKSTLRSRYMLVFFIGFSAFCYSDMTQMSFSMSELSTEMMAALILGIGVVLACTTLFLAVTAVLRQNTKTIAMLRVFGYSEQECADAILNGYRPVAYIGFIIGTIYQYGLLKIMVSVFYNQGAAEIPEYQFNVQGLIISLVSFLVLYEAFMYFYSKKISKISLKEVMLGE